jgi:hypothetical protein
MYITAQNKPIGFRTPYGAQEGNAPDMSGQLQLKF